MKSLTNRVLKSAALMLAVGASTPVLAYSPFWSCSKDSNPLALTIERNAEENREVLAIRDPEICETLGLDCPFVSIGDWQGQGVAEEFVAIPGEYAPGADFFHDGAGMKVTWAQMDRTLGAERVVDRIRRG